MIRVRDQGSVLLLALLLTLLIVAIGVMVLWVSRPSTSQRRVPRTRHGMALLAAEVGLERARAILAASDDWSALLGGRQRGGCGASGLAEGDDPSNKGNVLCDPRTKGARLWRVPVIAHQRGQGKMRARLSYTVYLRNDPLEDDLPRAGPFRDGDRRVVLRVEVIDDQGGRPAAIEVVVSAPPVAAPARSYRQQGLNAAANNAWQR